MATTRREKGEQKKPNVPVPDIADTTGFLSGVSAQLKLSQWSLQFQPIFVQKETPSPHLSEQVSRHGAVCWYWFVLSLKCMSWQTSSWQVRIDTTVKPWLLAKLSLVSLTALACGHHSSYFGQTLRDLTSPQFQLRGRWLCWVSVFAGFRVLGPKKSYWTHKDIYTLRFIQVRWKEGVPDGSRYLEGLGPWVQRLG